MAKPGVVFRRPVGSEGSFGEHAELPTDLGEEGRRRRAGASRRAGGRRRPVPDRSTRPRSGTLPSPTNGRRSSASANAPRRRPPPRRSASAGSRPSTRRKRPSTGLGGSMKTGQARSKPSGPRSTNALRPRTPAGRGRTRRLKPRCGERESRGEQPSIPSLRRCALRRDHVALGVPLQPSRARHR
jgi:hypothetical protein